MTYSVNGRPRILPDSRLSATIQGSFADLEGRKYFRADKWLRSAVDCCLLLEFSVTKIVTTAHN